MLQARTGRSSAVAGNARAAEPALRRVPARARDDHAPEAAACRGRGARAPISASGSDGCDGSGAARLADLGTSRRRDEVSARTAAASAAAPSPLTRACTRACAIVTAVALGLAALVGPAAAQAVPPQPGPFQACMGEKLTGRSLDDFSVRDAARACRDVTDEAGRAGLRQVGLDPATLEACAEKPLTDAEILRLRGASGPYFMMLTTFVWEVENIFPKRVLRSIEVRHYTPTMNEVGFSTRALIGPGGKGTFVLFDLGEMIPQLKHTLKIARMTYCELP